MYLIYLGVRLIFAKHDAAEDTAHETPTAPKSLSQLFTQGFVTNVLNPKKLVLFFVSFFPQFVVADSPHKTLAFLVLGAAFIAMSTA